MRAAARRDQPFVVVNCGAIPEPLIESELFGHAKGAFTGAVATRAGLFRTADGGTIFLDEIGDLPLPLQVKLLRVLQERSFTPIGSDTHVTVDVRIIAATNRSLEEEVGAQRFREDLFYRLNVLSVELPPLRDSSPRCTPVDSALFAAVLRAYIRRRCSGCRSALRGACRNTAIRAMSGSWKMSSSMRWRSAIAKRFTNSICPTTY